MDTAAFVQGFAQGIAPELQAWQERRRKESERKKREKEVAGLYSELYDLKPADAMLASRAALAGIPMSKAEQEAKFKRGALEEDLGKLIDQGAIPEKLRNALPNLTGEALIKLRDFATNKLVDNAIVDEEEKKLEYVLAESESDTVNGKKGFYNKSPEFQAENMKYIAPYIQTLTQAGQKNRLNYVLKGESPKNEYGNPEFTALDALRKWKETFGTDDNGVIYNKPDAHSELSLYFDGSDDRLRTFLSLGDDETIAKRIAGQTKTLEDRYKYYDKGLARQIIPGKSMDGLRWEMYKGEIVQSKDENGNLQWSRRVVTEKTEGHFFRPDTKTKKETTTKLDPLESDAAQFIANYLENVPGAVIWKTGAAENAVVDKATAVQEIADEETPGDAEGNSQFVDWAWSVLDDAQQYDSQQQYSVRNKQAYNWNHVIQQLVEMGADQEKAKQIAEHLKGLHSGRGKGSSRESINKELERIGGGE